MQSNNYANMLKRLSEYRKMLSMTKAEVAGFLQVSENRYSEFEDGAKGIPCSVICKLYESGWDMNYIIAGIEEPKKSSLKDELKEYGECDEKELILLFSWIFSNVIHFDDSMEEECRELELLEIITKGYENHGPETQSLVRTVREMMNRSQEELAEDLCVCVKTYRKIEKNFSKTNAQLLGDFCELSGFRPSLFLNTSVERDIIEHIWNVLKEDVKQTVLQFVHKGIQMISGECKNIYD